MVKVLTAEIMVRTDNRGQYILDLYRICAVVDLNDELVSFYGYEREIWYQSAINEIVEYLENRTVQSADSSSPANDQAAGSP